MLGSPIPPILTSAIIIIPPSNAYHITCVDPSIQSKLPIFGWEHREQQPSLSLLDCRFTFRSVSFRSRHLTVWSFTVEYLFIHVSRGVYSIWTSIQWHLLLTIGFSRRPCPAMGRRSAYLFEGTETREIREPYALFIPCVLVTNCSPESYPSINQSKSKVQTKLDIRNVHSHRQFHTENPAHLHHDITRQAEGCPGQTPRTIHLAGYRSRRPR